jgi:hypothetical protein
VKRMPTTSFSAPAPSQEHPAQPERTAAPSWCEVAPIVSALITTLEAIEAGKAKPVMKAHRSAMRRQGETPTALGGSKAMKAVLHQVAAADPARAERRLAFVREAWTGLSGWCPDQPHR